MESQTISPKMLINMGVFSAIYIVVLTTVGMISTLGPVLMMVGWVLCILINGTVVMLYLRRTPVFGALTIMGFAIGCLYMMMGSVWYMLIGGPAFGLIGDLINRAGGYTSVKNNILAYGVFTMWYTVPLAPIFFDSDNYFKQIAQYTNNQAYADQMAAIYTQPFIIFLAVMFVIVGSVSGWLGTKVLAKHFEKAGLA